MSGPFGSSQWMYNAGGDFYPYQIEQSLRFNDDDSAYLSRTPSSTSDQKKWTFSAWVKRGNLGTDQGIFSGNSYSGNDGIAAIYFEGDQLHTYYDTSGANPYGAVGPRVYRDASAWYHIVWAVDAVNTEHKIWVNNELVSTDASKYPPDFAYGVNRNGTSMGIGVKIWTPADYFDGYMAEVNFVDGEYITPTSFGETKSGIWVPKAYSGSYGTNGFYLSFADSSAIGDDLSGNGNDWTANNLVSTDVLLDSPTQNFSTYNVLAGTSTFANFGWQTKEGNLLFNAYEVNTYSQSVACTIPMQSGKWYFEFNQIGNTAGGNPYYGLYYTKSVEAIKVSNWQFSDVNASAFRADGNLIPFGSTSASSFGSASANGDIIQMAIDADNGKVWWGLNGTWFNSGNPAAGTNEADTFSESVVPVVSSYSAAADIIANFGQDSSFAGNKTAQGNTDDNGRGDFYYAPPSGYLALCTANLPEPAISPADDDSPSDYFNTVLYTGTGATQSITGVGFQPDWAWFKRRSATENHWLTDAVRGSTKGLFSNLTDAEATRTDQLTSFDADGFSLGADAAGYTNISGQSYVAWNWLAGNGTSANTDGTISSTVSVSQKAGFSIVSYTGTNSASDTTGHGLGVVPDMVILKSRTAARPWPVLMPSILGTGGTDYLYLNSTIAEGGDGSFGTGTLEFTSTTFRNIYAASDSGYFGGSGQDMIAYCFAEVEGYSKFGSYTGNGSTDGPFVWCGFRPAWVMVKRTDAIEGWYIYDATRDTFNVLQSELRADSSAAEAVFSSRDFLSNGFKVRTSNGSVNASGGTYIFMAFAENPFKYSNAR